MSKEAIEALEAARAHILDAYRIWQADDVSAVPPPKSGAGAVIAKIDAVLSTLPIAGGVKEIEWREDAVGDFAADTPFGIYTAWKFSWGWDVEFNGINVSKSDETAEAAKAAAQTDYETRILSSLISSPGKDGGQEERQNYNCGCVHPSQCDRSCFGVQPASTALVESQDYFGRLVADARVSADKAKRKFPQPNYVTLKIAEEAGEVVRGAVHYAENRMSWEEVEGEIVQLLAMLIRFVTEGDEINGVRPPALSASQSTSRENAE